MLTDRAYTFAEVAAIAYKDKYFSAEEGLKHLSKKTTPSTLPIALQHDLPPNSSEILREAKEMSDHLDQVKASGSASLHPVPDIGRTEEVCPQNDESNDDQDGKRVSGVQTSTMQALGRH